MQKKLLIIVAMACAFGAAHAQSTPAKKDLAARIIKIQQPGIEDVARQLAEEPAMNLMAAAERSLPNRVAPDKQEAVWNDIQEDVKKYLDDAVPMVRDRAVKLAPTSVGTFLEEKFSEDELKQVLAFLQSPAYIKFQKLGPDMQKALVGKIVADARPAMEPKVRTLESSIAKRLGLPAAPASGSK